MTRRTIFHIVSATTLLVCAVSTTATAQNRDFRTGRLMLDDNGGGGTMNTLTIGVVGDLPADRVLTIPDPGPSGGEFVLSTSGSINLTEIETPNASETLRLNPSGDLVQIGNSASPSTSSGLEVYGDVLMNGPTLTLSSSTGVGGIQVDGDDVNVQGDDVTISVTETVTIDGNLVVTGDLTVMGDFVLDGRLTANDNFNRIGSSTDAEQLRVRGTTGGSADHLFVVGNVRLTNELRIGSTTSNMSVFKTGAQTGQITYTLPTSLPAAAATGTSMGRGVMETGSNGAMTWRNAGSASAALDFASTNDGLTNDRTITVTGAVPGDLVILGIPNGSQPAGSVWYHAWVSANDTVTVRMHNQSGGAVDPASGTFSVMVMRP